MKISEEIRSGYAWSFASPFTVTVAIALIASIMTLFEGRVLDAVGVFFSSLMLFGSVSIISSALFCGVIGIPLYLLLRGARLDNFVVCSVLGGVIAYVITGKEGQGIQIIAAMYGLFCGYFFWLGANKGKVKLSSNKQKQADA